MNNVCHFADCNEFMKSVPDKFFDLAIVDPPYGIGDFRVGCGVSKTGKEKYKKIDWNNNTPNKKYFDVLYRISKHQIIFGFQYYMRFIKAKGIIIHNKKIPYEMNLSMADVASCSLQERVTLFDYRWQGMLQENMKNKQERIHPCEKPIALYKWLLQNYAKPGQKIFDSHVGSGSIRIACYDMGFDFTGCELDPDYWQAQEDRFKNHIAQNELFDKKEMQSLIFKE